jgi:prophage antirepressor-like protein
MNNTITTFTNALGNLRVVMLDDEPWFVAKDVAVALGYAKPEGAVRSHCKYQRTYPLESGGQVRHITIIPESDMYRLIIRSKLPSAERFEAWVTEDVLPAIRKDGLYVMGEEKVQTGEMSIEEMTLKVMGHLQSKVERLEAKTIELEGENEVLSEELTEARPKALVFDTQVAVRRETVSEYCRRMRGVNLNQLSASLKLAGYFFREAGGYRVRSAYRDTHFEEKHNADYGTVSIYPTEKGKMLLSRLYFDGKLTMKLAFRGSKAIESEDGKLVVHE